MTTLTRHSTLLVGVSNPATLSRLVDLSIRLATATGCEIVLTHVVRVPGQIGLGSARSSTEVVAARQLLEEGLARAHAAGVRAEGVVEVGREIHEGLVAAARSRAADIALVGYSEEQGADDERSERRFDRVMDRVAGELDADLVIAKFRGDLPDRLLALVQPSSDLALLRILVRALSGEPETSVRFLHLGRGDERVGEGSVIGGRLEEAGLADLGPLETVVTDGVVEAVRERVGPHDLLVLEMPRSPGSEEGLDPEAVRAIVDGVESSTLLVRGRGS